MEFNNKTILISGLIICSGIAMYLNYEQIALAIVSGLVGYLSKDAISSDSLANSISSDVNSSIPDEICTGEDGICSDELENCTDNDDGVEMK